MNAKIATPFKPNYAVAPGAILAEWLADHKLAASAFAQRLAVAPEILQGILAGSVSIDVEMAARLAETTCIPAAFWLSAETLYQAHVAARPAAQRDAQPRRVVRVA